MRPLFSSRSPKRAEVRCVLSSVHRTRSSCGTHLHARPSIIGTILLASLAGCATVSQTPSVVPTSEACPVEVDATTTLKYVTRAAAQEARLILASASVSSVETLTFRPEAEQPVFGSKGPGEIPDTLFFVVFESTIRNLDDYCRIHAELQRIPVSYDKCSLQAQYTSAEGEMSMAVRLCWKVSPGATIEVFYGAQKKAQEGARSESVCTPLPLLRNEEFVYAHIRLPPAKQGLPGIERFTKMSIFDRTEIEISEEEFYAGSRAPRPGGASR